MGNPISKSLSKAAKVVALARTSVPVTYVRLGLELAEARGIDREQLLRGIPIDREALERADGRVPLAPCVRLVSRVWRATHDAGLGYEFGLRSNLAAHGNIGYGLLSQTTVGEALAFGMKYGRLRNPILKLSLRTEGAHAVVEAREAIPLGPMRQYAIDAVLVSIARLARQLSGSFRPELELRFDCSEPAHFARYRHRLPPVVFDAAANQLRFPAEYLKRPMRTGNASTARVVEQDCERELALVGEVHDVAERVRALLAPGNRGYPDLDAVARKLHMSGRTLKRKLQQQGVGFLQLLDDARKRDSQKLLADPSLTVAEIAEAMGYTDPASFTRAFRKWAGVTPSAWRERAVP
jgi:AraC-like DNA-binding protein